MSIEVNVGDGASLPALILLHNRSQYLETQLETLVESKVKKVYVSIDGPRSVAEIRNQETIIQIINSFHNLFDVLEVRRSEFNLGLGLGIITGLDWFFRRNEAGMIFEDDVIFEQDCVRFFNFGIAFLKSREECLLLGGSNPFGRESSVNLVLTNYPQIWGWATTKDKWLKMREYIFKEPEDQVGLPRATREFWKTGWRRVNEGYVDTWDTPIAAGMRLDGSLCALPPVNLTSNRGADFFAVNTKKVEFPLGLSISKLSPGLIFDIASGSEIETINNEFEEEIYRVSYRHLFSNFARILDKLRFKNRKTPLSARLQILNQDVK